MAKDKLIGTAYVNIIQDDSSIGRIYCSQEEE